MFMANSFASTAAYRDIEFATCEDDRPLAVQFASNDDVAMTRAVEYVYNHCDAIDLNCGCPQKWIIQEGCGAQVSVCFVLYVMRVCTGDKSHTHP